jgi:hypothetical protein
MRPREFVKIEIAKRSKTKIVKTKKEIERETFLDEDPDWIAAESPGVVGRRSQEQKSFAVQQAAVSLTTRATERTLSRCQ